MANAIAAKCDLYLYTGNPGPGMVDLIVRSVYRQRNTKLLLIDRGQNDLIPDWKSGGYERRVYHAGYSGVSLQRVFNLPKLFFEVIKFLRSESAIPSRILINTHSLDLLFVAQAVRVFSINRTVEVVYQVRDLHRLQLSSGIKSSCVRFFERILLHGVKRVTVSSFGFKRYFERLHFRGELTLLENIPARGLFRGNSRKPSRREPGSLVVGYIGVVRYMTQISALIELVDGIDSIKLKIAGGTMAEDELAKVIAKSTSVEYSGPFTYSEEICELYNSIDVIFAVYDSNDMNCQLAMPNKFYEAILSRTPILVASGTFLADEVARLSIGLAVSSDLSDLRSALESVDDPQGWYERACKNLQEIDTDYWHERYTQQLDTAIGYSNDILG